MAKDKKSSKGCLSLFAGVFFFAGLIPGFLALFNIYEVWAARDWLPTPAIINSTELETHRGDDSTTYKVTARYQYTIAGQQYSSDSVGFSTGSDNIGDYHQDAHRQLQRHQQSQQPFTAWVNPDDPAEAVLYKTIRWPLLAFEILFMLIFSGVGAGLYLLGRHALKQKQDISEQQNLHPEKPWKWRREWQHNTLKSISSSARWMATGFAIFWNLISLPLWFVIPGEFASGNTLILLAALFPLVGIGLISWAVRQWLQYRRFGDSELILTHMPVSLGGLLKANLQLPQQVPDGAELNLVLNCIRKTTERSGGKTRTRENILWQGDQRIKLQVGSGSYRLVPIKLNIPSDQPEATVSTEQSEVIWRLQIQSELSGVDYEAMFELPVFDTGLITEADNQEEDFHKLNSESGIAGDPSRSGVVIEGNRYFFPAARHKGIALSLLLFCLVFGGTGVGIIFAGHPIFGGIFALVGTLILWAVLALLFKRSEIQLENGNLIAASGWFSLKEKLRLPSFQVKRLWIKSNMSSGNTKYYDLYLEDHLGKKHTLATNLNSRRDSEALIQHLEEALGLAKD